MDQLVKPKNKYSGRPLKQIEPPDTSEYKKIETDDKIHDENPSRITKKEQKTKTGQKN